MTAAIARVRVRDLRQIADAAVEPPDDEGADGEERDQLDHRFDGDGEDEAVLMLLRIDAARAERHRESPRAATTPPDRTRSTARGRQPRAVGGIDHHQHGRRDRLELQRDVGRRADQARSAPRPPRPAGTCRNGPKRNRRPWSDSGRAPVWRCARRAARQGRRRGSGRCRSAENRAHAPRRGRPSRNRSRTCSRPPGSAHRRARARGRRQTPRRRGLPTRR